jgi:hypothetical protein
VNLYTQFFRWFPWWNTIPAATGESLDPQTVGNIWASFFFVDILFNFTYWIALSCIPLTVYERFRRIYLSDFEISAMVKQASSANALLMEAGSDNNSPTVSPTKFFTKKTSTLIITVILLLMLAYSTVWCSVDAGLGFLGEDFKKQPMYVSVALSSKIIAGATTLFVILYEFILDVIMVLFLSKNVHASKKLLHRSDTDQLMLGSAVTTQIHENFMIKMARRIGALKTSTADSKLMFRVISLLIGILLCDVASLSLNIFSIFVMGIDGNTYFAVNLVSLSLITPHLHCGFTLIDFLYTSIKQLKNEVAAAQSAADKAKKINNNNAKKIQQRSFQSFSRTDMVDDRLLSSHPFSQSNVESEQAASYSRAPGSDLWLSSNAMSK